MSETITKTREALDTKILEPGRFKVIFLNDNMTPMDFVVALLMKVFHHSDKTAAEIMLKIHNEGSACAGIYSFEIAEQKGVESTNLARQNNYPLVVRIEPE
jgi:ATP-dependent Clp protease adaptor protein ClpS